MRGLIATWRARCVCECLSTRLKPWTSRPIYRSMAETLNSISIYPKDFVVVIV